MNYPDELHIKLRLDTPGILDSDGNPDPYAIELHLKEQVALLKARPELLTLAWSRRITDKHGRTVGSMDATAD